MVIIIDNAAKKPNGGKMKQRSNSLMFKIILLCAGLVLVSSLTIHLFAYRAAKSSIEYTLGQMALNITQSVDSTIDADKFEALVKSQDRNAEYYTQLKKELISMRQSTGLKFLYTMSKTDKGDYIYVVDGQKAGSEDESLLGDVEDHVSDSMLSSLKGKEAYEFSSDKRWGKLISGYVPIKDSTGNVVGMLGADFDASYMVDKLGNANRQIFIAAGIAFISSLLLSIVVAYMIIRSLKNLETKIELITNGDLTVQVGTNRSDEVGSLSRAFQTMVDSMSFMINNIRHHSETVVGEIDSLNNNVDISNKATEEITKIVSEIADGAATQVNSMVEVEDSMERVFTEIKKITNNIDQVNNDSDTCMNDMQEASEKLENTVEQINLVNNTVESTALVMKKLEDKFKEVLAFSDIVTAISRQTNLLALNASIEAASAGEHGKGFAVVADEIKNLAKQSSEASKRINELIIAVQEEIDHSSEAIGSGVVQARDGVSVMSQVKCYLDKLSDSNRTINIRIKEIATAIIHIEDDGKNVVEKATALSKVAKELSAGTQQTSAETEEQYAIMEAIRNDLVTVKNLMGKLGGSVNQFKVSNIEMENNVN